MKEQVGTVERTRQDSIDPLSSKIVPVDATSETPRNALKSFSGFKKIVMVTQVSSINLCVSAVNGLVVVGLPIMAADLHLADSLAFWPTSVNTLGTAASLMLAGSIADAFGARTIDLAGCFTVAALTLGIAWATDGNQLIVMRALQGIATAFHFAASVALITRVIPKGKSRNVSFCVLGLCQPLGFSFGLTVGGIMVDYSGWRTGWHIYGGITFLLSSVGLWALPHDAGALTLKERCQSLQSRVDWIGALLITAFMAIVCYLLAVLSSDTSKIHNHSTIVLLALSTVTLPCFALWMNHRTKTNRVALVPNYLWKNTTFSSIYAITSLSFATVNAMELCCCLYFQEVQHLSALDSSIRILPSLVVGVVLGVTTGLFVHRVSVVWLVSISSALCAGGPLIMALIEPHWSYWLGAFEAQILCPLSVDILFTVGLIITSEVFTEDTQALASAVFNTAAYFGTTLGISIVQMVSASVTKQSRSEDRTGALLEGYRAGFWALFGFMLLCLLFGVLGLRKTGKVGKKEEPKPDVES